MNRTTLLLVLLTLVALPLCSSASEISSSFKIDEQKFYVSCSDDGPRAVICVSVPLGMRHRLAEIDARPKDIITAKTKVLVNKITRKAKLWIGAEIMRTRRLNEKLGLEPQKMDLLRSTLSPIPWKPIEVASEAEIPDIGPGDSVASWVTKVEEQNCLLYLQSINCQSGGMFISVDQNGYIIESTCKCYDDGGTPGDTPNTPPIDFGPSFDDENWQDESCIEDPGGCFGIVPPSNPLLVDEPAEDLKICDEEMCADSCEEKCEVCCETTGDSGGKNLNFNIFSTQTESGG